MVRLTAKCFCLSICFHYNQPFSGSLGWQVNNYCATANTFSMHSIQIYFVLACGLRLSYINFVLLQLHTLHPNHIVILILAQLAAEVYNMQLIERNRCDDRNRIPWSNMISL